MLFLLERFHLFCDVDYPLKQLYAFAGDVNLFRRAAGRESVFEQIALRSAEAVKVGVGAVVVGYEKALAGNE